MFVAILPKPVRTAPHPESDPWLDRNLMGNRSRTVLDAVDDTPLINRSQSISVGLQKCQFQRGAFEAMCCPIDISWGKSPILEFQLTFLEARVQYWSSNWHFLRQESNIGVPIDISWGKSWYWSSPPSLELGCADCCLIGHWPKLQNISF
jgi:hypothetical protein